MSEVKNTITLRVEHYKGVERLRVVLEPGASVFGGKNDAGKSSVLDAVANAFGGKKLSPPKPVKDGAEGYECSVGLEKLGIQITRTGRIGEDGVLREKLTIEDAEGFKSSSPQALLDKLLDGNSIRPRAFAELTKAQQIEMLKGAAGIDWTVLDIAYQEAFEARHDAGVRVAALEAQVVVALADPGPVVDLASIRDDLAHAAKHNAGVAAQQVAAKEREKALASLGVQLRQAEASVVRMKKEIARQETVAAREVPVGPVDVESLQEAYSQAEHHNREVEVWEQRTAALEALAAERTEASAQDEVVQNIRRKKSEQVAEADLPVPGLAFDESGVYLKGVPFEQASQSERLEASVRLGLALHPQVPIVLVHEGSFFDAEHLKALDAVAKEHEAFVFVEAVMDEPEEGVKVFMVDGIGEVRDEKGE